MSRTVTQRWQDAEVTGGKQPFRVRVEVYVPTPDLWIDINKVAPDCAEDLWYDLLAEPPRRLSTGSELNTGRFTSTISSLVLKDRLMPDDTYLFADSSWVLYSGSTAYTLDTWYRAQVRVRISHQVDSTAWQHEACHIFLVENVTRDPRTHTAKLKLVGKERLLIDAKAKDCREGDAWFTNIPADLCAKELIKRAGKGDITFESGSPASSTVTTEESVVSLLGNFPVKNGSGDWNRRKQHVPRYGTAYSTGVFWVGYDISANRPSITYWDGADWQASTCTDTDFNGFEGVYTVNKTGDQFWIFCVSNKIDETESHPGFRQQMQIALYDISANTWTTIYTPRLITILGCGVQKASRWYHSAGVAGYTQYWGHISGGIYGERPNLGCYFKQEVSAPDKWESSYPLYIGGTTNSETSGEEPFQMSDMTTFFPGIEAYTSLNAEDFIPDAGCYHAHKAHSSDEQYKWPARPWYHGSTHESFKYNAERGAVYWIDHANNQWHLCKFLVSDGSWSRVNIGLPNLSWGASYTLTAGASRWWEAYWITAFDVYDEGTTAFAYFATVTGPHSLDSSGDGERPPPESHLYKFTWGSGNLTSPTDLAFAGTRLTCDWATRYFPALISIRANPGGGTKLFGQVLNLWTPAGQSYGFWFWVETPSQFNGVFRGSDTGAHYPISTVPFELCDTFVSAFNYTTYAVDQATGALWSFSMYSGSPTQCIPASLSPVDGESTWASCNPVLVGSDVYGVSASAPPACTRTGLKYDNYWGWRGEDPQLGTNTPPGRITVWQYKKELTNVVPCADFGGANVWDALEMLREISGDFVVGFSRSGEFYFKSRGGSGSFNLSRRDERVKTVSISSPRITCERISSYLDFGSIVNSVQVAAYEPGIKQPTASIVRVPDSDVADMSIIVNQVSKEAQRIVLTCISGSVARDPDSATEEDRPLLFSFGAILDDVSCQLSHHAQIGDQEIFIYGLYTDETGAYKLGNKEIRVGDTIQVGDGNLTTIASMELGTGDGNERITLDDTVGGSGTHSQGTQVVITPQDRYRYADSADGLCAVDGAKTLTGGTALTVTFSSTENLRPGMVIWGDWVPIVYMHVLDVVNGTDAIVKPGVLGTLGSGETASLVNTSLIRGAIWVDRQGKSYGIGATGVSFGLLQKSRETSRAGGFHVGDQIRITCFGLTVEEMEHSVFRATAGESVTLYGAKAWKPRIKNRLITPARARWMLETLDHLKDPAHVTTADGADLIFGVDVGTQIRVDDSYLFTEQVTHKIIGIDFDLRAGAMSLRMRSSGEAQRGEQGTEHVAIGVRRGSRRGRR